MAELEIAEDLSGLDESLAALPNSPAVFLLHARQGDPYLARTALLRRRLLRLLKKREGPSRLLNLRDTARRIEYYFTGSSLEASVRMYELARRHFPDRYAKVMRLRMPPYVKIVLANAFPRALVTTHLSRTPAVYYGPFRNRSTAEYFQSQMLDLFQMRRCQEDLEPSPSHPGCIYGEMGMCLRPCQEVVGADEYKHEVDRVIEFLASDGKSLIDSVARQRDRYSEEMMFEEAARQHKRMEKIAEVLKSRDELARELRSLHGVAITAAAEPEAIELWPVREGVWHEPRRFSLEVTEGKRAPMDRRLREAIEAMQPAAKSMRERAEYLALLARWFYSSWRDGEWIPAERGGELPYRKLVNAVSRVARRGSGP